MESPFESGTLSLVQFHTGFLLPNLFPFPAEEAGFAQSTMRKMQLQAENN